MLGVLTLRLFGPLTLGDVDGGADNLRGATFRVAHDQEAIQHINVMPLFVENSILGRITGLASRRELFGQRLSDFRQETIAVIRVNAINPPFKLWRRLIRLKAGERGESFAPYGDVVADVVFVDIAVESAQRDPVPPVRSLQSLFGEFAVGDILRHPQNLRRIPVRVAVEDQIPTGEPPPPAVVMFHPALDRQDRAVGRGFEFLQMLVNNLLVFGMHGQRYDLRPHGLKLALGVTEQGQQLLIGEDGAHFSQIEDVYAQWDGVNQALNKPLLFAQFLLGLFAFGDVA